MMISSNCINTCCGPPPAFKASTQFPTSADKSSTTTNSDQSGNMQIAAFLAVLASTASAAAVPAKIARANTGALVAYDDINDGGQYEAIDYNIGSCCESRTLQLLLDLSAKYSFRQLWQHRRRTSFFSGDQRR